MKSEIARRASRICRAGLAVSVAAGLGLAGARAQTTPAQPPVDPATHAAHVAAGTHPAGATQGDPALAQRLAELRETLAQIEAALAQNTPSRSGSAPPAAVHMPGMAAPADRAMNMTEMMGKMDKMMGMMDRMMSMRGDAMPAGAPMPGADMGMGMKDTDMMKMGGMGGGSGSMPGMSIAAPGGMGMGMGMKGMDMDMMKMMGMEKMQRMGMMGGMKGMNMPSALPGFPGASHLYHIGASGYFLDHPEHITLDQRQQAALNAVKERAELNQASLDRKIAEAEQELWVLTSSDQPDAGKIEAKVRDIEKLRGDKRLGFIRSVGEAAKVLTEDQRRVLTGLAEAQPGSSGAAHQH